MNERTTAGRRLDIMKTAPSARFHALDSARVSAMLLGVLYHALVFHTNAAAVGRTDLWGPFDPTEVALSAIITQWLHSFRMPLFFAISGFFCHMMLGKYGPRHYLAKRWWRIGAPMLAMLFAVALGHVITRPDPTSVVYRLLNHHFMLGHLWFLWYLLAFSTIAPLIAKMTPEKAYDLGRWSVRNNTAPWVLGLLTVPTLMRSGGDSGWALGPAGGICGTLFQYQRDMPFYLTYVLAGWWLYRVREALPDLARSWFRNLAVGCFVFALSRVLSRHFITRTDLAYHGHIRLLSYATYAIGSAHLCWGFLGVFQKYLDRPGRIWKYLADAALWIYLTHLIILDKVLVCLAPLVLPWWGRASAASTLAVAVAIVLFEVFVRPTPLCYLFGPARARPLGEGPEPVLPPIHISAGPVARPGSSVRSGHAAVSRVRWIHQSVGPQDHPRMGGVLPGQWVARRCHPRPLQTDVASQRRDRRSPGYAPPSRCPLRGRSVTELERSPIALPTRGGAGSLLPFSPGRRCPEGADEGIRLAIDIGLRTWPR